MTSNPDRAWYRGGLTALVTCLLLGMVGGIYIHDQKTSRQLAARNLAHNFALRLSQRTHETVSPAYMLGAMVKKNQGSLPEFNQLAADLLQEFPLARALELAPAGVVRQVYPLRGNEAILGHDLLKDRARNWEAHLALTKRQLMLAGPFELLQGGRGLVGRYPIFLPNAAGKSVFWGFSIVLIHLDDLLANSGVMDFNRAGFAYQLCRVRPAVEPAACEPFAGSGGGGISQPLLVLIELPNNRWQLSLAPANGWISAAQWGGLLIAVIGGSLLAGLLHVQLIRQSDSVTECRAGSVSQEG